MLPKQPATQTLDWWLMVEEMWRSQSTGWTNIRIPKLVGFAPQFLSKFVFKLLTLIHAEIGLGCHYNKAHHGKGPMGGIEGTVKNTVFRKVLSGEIVISSPEEIARYARSGWSIHSNFRQLKFQMRMRMYIIPSIPDTLKTHRVVCVLSKHKIPYLKF